MKKMPHFTFDYDSYDEQVLRNNKMHFDRVENKVYFMNNGSLETI